MKIKNPVLKGFNADPSFIRVGDTYYIANSTFEWYPGVQIHESKDLVHWRLVAHPLSTSKLLDMTGVPDSGGIWAPDLSYHDGKFWLIYTDVKVTEGAFKDAHNYLTTATSVRGPWSGPIPLNSSGFDASLFHDDDGKKYLVNMYWDSRDYHHNFYGIQCTEYSEKEKRLLPETSRIIYKGTDVKLVEGPHLYKINGYYYLFCAQGGTTYTHQEVVARATSLDGKFETQSGEVFLTSYDAPFHYLQKAGHGSLVGTPEGEWYFAHLMARPIHRPTESAIDPRGWAPLGRETSIQKVEWDEQGWPRIVSGKQGQVEVDAPKGVKETPWEPTFPEKDDFDDETLNINFQWLRKPLTEDVASLKERPGNLRLYGKESLSSLFTQAHIARRWQAFNFDAETAVSYRPTTFQQFAGMTNYYNTRHWTTIHITWNEINGRVIEVVECDRNHFTSYLKDKAILVPEDVEYVHFKVKVRKTTYTYAYSFDGTNWIDLPFIFDSTKLSDDYVLQTYGGFFTGAFVGMVNVDGTGSGLPADFDYFTYRELDEE